MRSALALAAVLVAVGVSPASAYYGNATLVSASLERQEQGDDNSPLSVISRDGRYVVFQTRARNFFADDDPDPPGRYRAGGTFRRDLDGGGLQLVADGDLRDEEDDSLLVRGSQGPSVSADGRFVAFSTAQQLVPLDQNENVDVYVRDMNVPLRAPGAYELVSARDGGDVPATYAQPDPPQRGGNPGAELTPAQAISRDGQRVVFRTTASATDLPAPDTPGGQVLVRDRGAKTTTLVTTTMETSEPAGGALQSAISGDGSTVTWTGFLAQRQTPFLRGEIDDQQRPYYLWKRVADGPDAPTRRITGIVDLDDPACDRTSSVVQDGSVTGPCYGPLTSPEWVFGSIGSQVPSLSADGRTATFLTGAGPRPNVETGAGFDLFVADMSPGVSRKAGTEELSREGSGDTGASFPVDGIAISPDGRYIAAATTRTRFVLPRFRFLGTQRPFPDARELYLFDRSANTVERLTRSFDGGDVRGDLTIAVSLSDGADRAAFTSAAGNLFFGDANERVDAFAIRREAEPTPDPPPPPPAEEPPSTIEDPPPAPGLGVRITRRRDGSLRLILRPPEAGALNVTARSRGPSRRGRAARGRVRTVAKVTGRARSRLPVGLTLAPSARYRKAIRRGESMRARLTVTFTATSNGRRLTRRLSATFRRSPPKRARKR